jgi:hypothetical protein
VTQVGERMWLVTFMHYDLGYFELRDHGDVLGGRVSDFQERRVVDIAAVRSTARSVAAFAGTRDRVSNRGAKGI